MATGVAIAPPIRFAAIVLSASDFMLISRRRIAAFSAEMLTMIMPNIMSGMILASCGEENREAIISADIEITTARAVAPAKVIQKATLNVVSFSLSRCTRAVLNPNPDSCADRLDKSPAIAKTPKSSTDTYLAKINTKIVEIPVAPNCPAADHSSAINALFLFTTGPVYFKNYASLGSAALLKRS